jgi:hypothetical protein
MGKYTMVDMRELLGVENCISMITVMGGIGVNRSNGRISPEVEAVPSYMTSCHPTCLTVTKLTNTNFGWLRACPYAWV